MIIGIALIVLGLLFERLTRSAKRYLYCLYIFPVGMGAAIVMLELGGHL